MHGVVCDWQQGTSLLSNCVNRFSINFFCNCNWDFTWAVTRRARNLIREYRGKAEKTDRLMGEDMGG